MLPAPEGRRETEDGDAAMDEAQEEEEEQDQEKYIEAKREEMRQKIAVMDATIASLAPQAAADEEVAEHVAKKKEKKKERHAELAALRPIKSQVRIARQAHDDALKKCGDVAEEEAALSLLLEAKKEELRKAKEEAKAREAALAELTRQMTAKQVTPPGSPARPAPSSPAQ